MSKLKLATVWLDGCSGCHMSLLDIDERILAVLSKVEIVYGPLVDAQEFPSDVDLTLVEGAVSSYEDLEKARLIRERSRLVVALGDCAVTSNISAMRNTIPVKKLIESVYLRPGNDEHVIPRDGVPKLLRQAVPLERVIPVDLHVPGCPPPADAIFYALSELLEGRMPVLAGAVKFG